MNNLRNLRKAKGLSLAELHRMTGYPLRTLEDWDSERKIISSYHRIKRLSEILGVTMDEFMTKQEKCVFGGENAYISFVQEEGGVNITILNEHIEVVFYETVPREKALDLLKFLKTNKDITGYVDEYL